MSIEPGKIVAALRLRNVTSAEDVVYNLILIDGAEEKIKAEFGVRRAENATWLRTNAGAIFQSWWDRREQLGDSVNVAEAAAIEFENLCSAAQEGCTLARSASKGALKNWDAYRRILLRAMRASRKGEFIERDEAGDYRHNGITACQKLAEKLEAEAMEETKLATIKAAAAAGNHIKEAKSEPVKDKASEQAGAYKGTGTAPEGVSQTASDSDAAVTAEIPAEILDQARELLSKLKELSALDQERAGKVLKQAIEKADGHLTFVRNTMAKVKAAAQAAAAA